MDFENQLKQMFEIIKTETKTKKTVIYNKNDYIKFCQEQKIPICYKDLWGAEVFINQ